MNDNVPNNRRHLDVSYDNDTKSAINSLILDYYQKFGRKRDLEQFFSLSTAQSDIQDPASSFWRKMKVHGDTSDSGDCKTETSTALCRISIECTLPESSSSQDEHIKSKDESESPPIIIEEPELPLQTQQDSTGHSDNESVKYDENNSQKSAEAHLDLSATRPFSPTSSLNSQRKLEWDSLADVGYGNESGRKASGSSLSTLERLALHQQYSNNDTKESQYGAPNSHSTPLDDNLNKGKKSHIKSLKVHKKDIDIVELNVPRSLENSGAINVNLTKHISFNVDKDGDITIMRPKENPAAFADKVSVETEMTPQIRIDKEIQTYLAHNKSQSTSTGINEHIKLCEQKFPILISLNTLKRRKRRKKYRYLKNKLCSKGKIRINTSKAHPDKIVNQISEAESFEYMPGHIYNQNQVQNDNVKNSNSIGNKSSLESSVPITTDSSKATINSFTKDLEKSIDILQKALHSKYDDSHLKERLIKEVVQRLLSKKYRDDKGAYIFLSDLSLNNKKTGSMENFQTTTSTSDENNIEKSNRVKKPKKSILRADKFNPSGMASTSQSTPNLHTLVQKENSDNKTLIFSNTESDFSSRERNSSDTITKLSSEELYKKYLVALKREKVHKEVLKNKEALLKKKLVSSDSCLKKVPEFSEKSKERLYELIKDLAHNKINDGSGDANQLKEGHSPNKYKSDLTGKQRSHSVFTLTSGKLGRSTKTANNTTCHNIRQNTEGRSSDNVNSCIAHPATSEVETAGCLIHDIRNHGEKIMHKNCQIKCQSGHISDLTSNKHGYSNKPSPRCVENIVVDNTSDVQYVCLCPGDSLESLEVPNKLLIYKCTGIGSKGMCLANTVSKESTSIGVQCNNNCVCGNQIKHIKLPAGFEDKIHSKSTDLQCGHSSSSVINPSRKASTSSQTNSNLNIILGQTPCIKSTTSMSPSEGNKQGIFVNRGDKEVTRSIQTEINIDPKISEPTLSDVKIVHDLGGVQFDSEQYTCQNALSSDLNRLVFDEVVIKQPSKCNDPQTRFCGEQKNTYNKVNFSNDLKPSNRQTQQEGKENESNSRDPKSHNEKFSIPIQGTNMTLVVSLGSNMEDDPKLKQDLQVDTKGLINETYQCVNQNAASNGFSKGVQCGITDIFPQMNNDRQQYVRDGNTKPINPCCSDNSKISINDDQSLTKPRRPNKHINDDCCKYNTYPKRELNTRKPFERSNTDTDRLIAMCSSMNKNANINVETKKDCSDALSKDDIFSNKEEFQVPLKNEQIDSKTCQYNSQRSKVGCGSGIEDNASDDPLLNIIQDITKRYTKKDMENTSRKKCFKEIMTVLNYLLDTEDSSDERRACASIKSKSDVSKQDDVCAKNRLQRTDDICSRRICGEHTTKKTFVDRGVQLGAKGKTPRTCTESSDIPTSSEVPTTSTDTTTCKVLNKIRKECERYHQKKCKSGQKRCDESTTTSTVHCEKCNRQHYCSCRSKCKIHKTRSGPEKGKKKCVAYNLIIQTSDSLVSEETVNQGCRPLQNVVVKVPPKSKNLCNAPFKEVAAKIEKKMPQCNPQRENVVRCRSLPNDSEMSGEDFGKKMRNCTVRDYLEMNRPDFVEKSTQRQSCLKMINQSRLDDVCASSGYKTIVVHAPECNGGTYLGPCNTYCSTGVPMTCEQFFNQFMPTNCGEVKGFGEPKGHLKDI